MKNITNKKNIIKDYSSAVFVLVVVAAIVFSLMISVKYDTATLLTFEQTIFVILSAILFVFHESVIGYSTISKIRNSINNFKKREIEKDYDEFLNTVEDDIIVFQENITEFKRKSFMLYSFFAIFGLMIIAISMIDGSSFIFTDFSFFNDKVEILVGIKHFMIDYFVSMQIFTIPVWVISAFQAEHQKHKMIKYFEVDTISLKIKEYVEQTRKKSINFRLNGLSS